MTCSKADDPASCNTSRAQPAAFEHLLNLKLSSLRSNNIAKAIKAVFIPSADNLNFANTTVQLLDGLVARRKQWEGTDYKKANEGLYSLLAECLSVFSEKFVNADAGGKKTLRDDLSSKLKADGVKVQRTTPTLTMFVRYVFGSDRKRAHGYAYVLKAAISNDVSASELCNYIAQEGGIEEVKRKMVVKEETLAKRAAVEAAKTAVKSEIERALASPVAKIAMAGVTGEYALMLAKPMPNGSVDIVGVLPEVKQAMVNAVIAQLAKRKVVDDEARATLDKEATDLLAGSLAAANTAELKQAA